MDPRLFESLAWRCIGPHRGGRVVAVAGHPTERGTFYFGACAGGVWKTTDGGAHWVNVSDGYFGTAAIGALAVSEADPNVIYAGTGEACIRGNVSYGDGVYRSTDGGRSWRNVGLHDTRHIGDVVVHPRDPDTVYVAALGHAFGPNEERGVFRSRDGGASWEKVLYKSANAGSTDIALDPNNPRIVFANIWEARRQPYRLDSGGVDSGLWRSFDGGDSWEEITRRRGLPEGVLGKIGVAVSPARTGRVWALVEAEDGALFRSDDYGDTWERISEDPDLRRRAFYYMHIYADPQDPETVWVLNMPLKKSVDGGKTFQSLPIPHGDNHDLWIDPNDPQRMIEGNDGGACVTYNGGRSWSTLLNQPTAQFYHVTTDEQFPYRVYGSQQDNWTISLPSIGFDGAITWSDWIVPGGGESGYIAVQPVEPHLVFGGAIGNGPGPGKLIAWDPRTRQHRDVAVWPEDHGFGEGAKPHKYRFQWTFPIEFSPHDPRVVHICSNHVHRSTDGGTTWEAISPDLTRNDETKLEPSGGPITRDNSGVEIYGTIFAFRVSPHTPGLFWAGSDDGLVHISHDGGANWEDITPPDLPEWSLISIIEPSPHDAATAYVAATRYKHDDTRPYLYKTSDYGKSWTRITNGIPDSEYTRVIREDPGRKGLLYAGTETGLYISFDDGASWQPFQGGLPVCPIHDLIVKGTDLVVATHGRSFWILDDVTPLHQLHDEVASEAAALFAPRPTHRLKYTQYIDSRHDDLVSYRVAGPVTVAYQVTKTADGDTAIQFLDAGKNPPDGVVVHFWLREKPEGEVTLAFYAADGIEIRRFSSTSEDDATKLKVRAGANRFVWNMRYAPAAKLEEESKDMFAEFVGATPVPKALPGSYRVDLTIGDQTFSQPFEILTDPRVPAGDADLRAQFELLAAIRDKESDLNGALNRLRRRRKQLAAWSERAKNVAQPDGIGEHAGAIEEKLAQAEGELLQVKAESPLGFPNRLREKLHSLARVVDSADAAPTRQSREVYDDLARRVDEQLSWLDEVVEPDLEAFNQRVHEAGLAPVE
jgi:photosystem II stability/assembly factor-like uncharacterized protein